MTRCGMLRRDAPTSQMCALAVVTLCTCLVRRLGTGMPFAPMQFIHSFIHSFVRSFFQSSSCCCHAPHAFAKPRNPTHASLPPNHDPPPPPPPPRRHHRHPQHITSASGSHRSPPPASAPASGTAARTGRKGCSCARATRGDREEEGGGAAADCSAGCALRESNRSVNPSSSS